MSDPNLLPPNVLDVDGRMLRTFLAVLETGSVTEAGRRLGVTQSAVSHALDRLRDALGDPLFVKSGRGIVATARAEGLAAPARQLLDDLDRLSRGPRFVPEEATLALAVAANDFQRDLLLPAFRRRVSSRIKDLRLTVIPSRAPHADLLREARCDLIVTPRPPEGSDIMLKRLLVDRFECFFDPQRRGAALTLEEYVAARHVSIAYEDGRRLAFDDQLEARGVSRRISVTVTDFAGIAAFLRGTDMLATLPSLSRRGSMRAFGSSPLPFAAPALSMYMVWHRRRHADPAHVWLRSQLEESVQELTAASASTQEELTS